MGNEKYLDEVPAKAYGKGELAAMYYPDSSPSWALRLFNADLRRMPGLTDRLAPPHACSASTGYA